MSGGMFSEAASACEERQRTYSTLVSNLDGLSWEIDMVLYLSEMINLGQTSMPF